MFTAEIRGKKIIVRTLALLSISAAALIASSIAAAHPGMQVTVMPGSADRGERLLAGKGCLTCHAVNGQGGKRAPDFARPSAGARTPALFASLLWNHSPKMWAAFKNEKRPLPPMDSLEVADLFAYFYSTLYFSPQGSASRGREIFEQKRCASCHPEVLDTRLRGSILGRWADVRDPIGWAERMWNHATEMDSATTQRGIRWPALSEQDIADLLMFLSNFPETEKQLTSFKVGEPDFGRTVFERACETCHSFGEGGKSKVDLLGRPRPLSLTGYIAAMWNHAPEMRRRGGSTPVLNPGEMGSLIAFLFSQRYFLDRGDITKGRRVFESKDCANCHERHRKDTGAPDLAQVTEVFSPITLASAVWRHGPAMVEKMEQQGMRWPEFRGSEMADLITYLNSRLVTRVAIRTKHD